MSNQINKASFKIILGEFIGTFILVFVGCGAIALSVLKIIKFSPLSIAIIWGIGLACAIYITRGLSGAHLNPAVTIAFVVYQRYDGIKTLIVYILSQISGAFAAGGLLFLIFNRKIASFEKAAQITRGLKGSQLSAMIFGEYFPNPSLSLTFKKLLTINLAQAILAELIGTSILVFVILILTSPKYSRFLKSVLIGTTLSILIYFIAPITQAGLNPARDFGPRLVSYLTGWGKIAIPGPNFGFIAYIIGPILGGLIGGGLYRLIRGFAGFSNKPNA